MDKPASALVDLRGHLQVEYNASRVCRIALQTEQKSLLRQPDVGLRKSPSVTTGALAQRPEMTKFVKVRWHAGFTHPNTIECSVVRGDGGDGVTPPLFFLQQ